MAKVPATYKGKVTEEELVKLEEVANRYKKPPWTMGVSSHVMAAIIGELRELRETGITLEQVLENRIKLRDFWIQNREDGEFGIGPVLQKDGGMWITVRCECCNRHKRYVIITPDGKLSVEK